MVHVATYVVPWLAEWWMNCGRMAGRMMMLLDMGVDPRQEVDPHLGYIVLGGFLVTKIGVFVFFFIFAHT